MTSHVDGINGPLEKVASLLVELRVAELTGADVITRMNCQRSGGDVSADRPWH